MAGLYTMVGWRAAYLGWRDNSSESLVGRHGVPGGISPRGPLRAPLRDTSWDLSGTPFLSFSRRGVPLAGSEGLGGRKQGKTPLKPGSKESKPRKHHFSQLLTLFEVSEGSRIAESRSRNGDLSERVARTACGEASQQRGASQTLHPSLPPTH